MPSFKKRLNSTDKSSTNSQAVSKRRGILDVFSIYRPSKARAPPLPLQNPAINDELERVLRSCRDRLAALSETRKVYDIIEDLREMHPLLEKPLDAEYMEMVSLWLEKSATSYQKIEQDIEQGSNINEGQLTQFGYQLALADETFYQARDKLTKTEREFHRNNTKLQFVHGYDGTAVLKITESSRIGGFGVILYGLHYGHEKHLPDRAVVMKQLLSRTGLAQQKLRQRFLRELLIWNTLDHPNIVPCLGAFGDLHVLQEGYDPKSSDKKKDELFLVSEFSRLLKVNQETSNKFVAIHRSSLPEIADGIVSGIIYLHQQGVRHGDLKGNNIIMFDDNGTICPKITDFGLSAIVGTSNKLQATQKGGARRWAAPEFLQSTDSENLELEESSDIWSFGTTLEELILCAIWEEHDAPPFFDIPSKHDDSMFLNFMKFKDDTADGTAHIDSKIIDYLLIFPACLQDLISKCLSAQKQQRPSTKEFSQMWKNAYPHLKTEWETFQPLLDQRDAESGYLTYFERVDEWREKNNKGSSSLRIPADG